MKLGNLIIVILLIIIAIFGGMLAFKIHETGLVRDGMNYAEDKATESKKEVENKEEKEKIQLAITMAKLLNKAGGYLLTYNNLNDQLKESFDTSNYKLSGPDVASRFNLEINSNTYIITENGEILE